MPLFLQIADSLKKIGLVGTLLSRTGIKSSGNHRKSNNEDDKYQI